MGSSPNIFKVPKNDSKYHWTNHVIRKMVFYALTPDRVKRVIRNPKRTEKGVAPDTIAVMQPAGTAKRPTEIWVMYAVSLSARRRTLSELSESKGNILSPLKIVITAWRYPGISPIRDEIPIPSDILNELKEIRVWQNLNSNI